MPTKEIIDSIGPADKHAIKWLMGRVHVLTTNEAVRADMQTRFAAQVTPGVMAEIEQIALEEHAANFDLYKSVMTGRF